MFRHDDFLKEYNEITYEEPPLIPTKPVNVEFEAIVFNDLPDDMKLKYAHLFFSLGTWTSGECWKISADSAASYVGSFFFKPTEASFAKFYLKEEKSEDIAKSIVNKIIEKVVEEAEKTPNATPKL